MRHGPREAGHPSIGKMCPACRKPFAIGDYWVLVPLGPGDDPVQRDRARRGLSYDTVAVEVHYECSGGRS